MVEDRKLATSSRTVLPLLRTGHTRDRFTDTENRLVVTKGKGRGGGEDWEFGMSRGKLLYVGRINNKVPL